MAESICPHCGKPVPEAALGGLCPDCMLLAGMAKTEPKAAAPPPKAEEIAPLFPQLEILECLGRGGMGAVYKARQPKLNRIVALKILARDKEADPKFAERFTREAQALARLNHQNIVTVYDFGEVDGHCYLLMEFVDGLNLRQLMRSGNLLAEQALKIVPSICEALQFAHEQGVVHRDIKPENILLDRNGRVKIADFGIAKILGDEAERANLTAEQQVIGTPHYMAPEQVEHPRAVDHRADIFSLGVVFYEMLTGELPLGKFQPPSRKVQVDVRLDEVVLHALEKEPDRRYQHASEVKTDVETIAASPSKPGGGTLVACSNRVRIPAIGLFVAGCMDLVTITVLLFGKLFMAAEVGSSGTIVPQVLWIPLQFLSLAALAAAALLSGLVIIGASQMRVLANRNLAITAAALAIVLSPGSVIGLPFGIWSLVILTRREVREAFETRVKRAAAAKPPSKWVKAARWTARVFGTLLLVFYATFIIAEGLPPIASQPEGVQLNFIALGLMLGGFIVGWRREGTAALLIASGWTLWQISEGGFRRNIFQTPLPVAALYAFCWWASHRQRTVRLVLSTVALATALGLGLLFVPTNVFVRGRIVDAASGTPLRDVELRLPSRAGQPASAAPNARSDQDGGYRLYVGWYSPVKQITLAAPGYVTLATNLGPRNLGQRNVSRNFSLRPVAVSEESGKPSAETAAPVVVGTFPVSGTSGVDPSITELRATFSKPMRGAAWCRTDEFASPNVTGPPRYLDERTCVLPVRLDPGRVYGLWLNTEGAMTFRDLHDRPAVPYLLIFETRK